jgi:RNA polymerase sigma-70 factor, ECF subfamily
MGETSPRASEAALLALAMAGSETAFADLVGDYRSELRAHCYRMLGSVHDAEDALQDALLRAWRNLSGFEGRSSFRSWLYAIATNTAIDIGRHRSRRELPVGFGPPAADADGRPGSGEAAWLEPFPDQLLPDLPPSPEARYDQRESIELAFLLALQELPPAQRAVLILRDVLAFSAAEVAAQLGTSVAAVNSALQRARAAAADGGLPARSQQANLSRLGDRQVLELARRYADAIEHADADTLIGMLTADASWSMPPHPTWFQGHAAVLAFLADGPFQYPWRHRTARANGQLAVGCYLPGPDGSVFVPAVLDVLTLDRDKITAVTGFHMPEMYAPPESVTISGAEIFARFGLPAELS